MKSIESIEYFDHHALRLHSEWILKKTPGELFPFLQELKQNSRVLDLGCGSGIDLGWIAQAGHQCVGLDASARMVSLAQSFYPTLDVRQKNFLFLTLEAGEYDAIWINGSFNLFAPEVVQRVVAICFKGVSSNGVLGVVLDEGQGAFEDRSGDLSGPSKQVHLYQEKQICSMIEQTGFRVDRVGRANGKLLILARRVG